MTLSQFQILKVSIRLYLEKVMVEEIIFLLEKQV